jgi:hypothetical protein
LYQRTAGALRDLREHRLARIAIGAADLDFDEFVVVQGSRRFAITPSVRPALPISTTGCRAWPRPRKCLRCFSLRFIIAFYPDDGAAAGGLKRPEAPSFLNV